MHDNLRNVCRHLSAGLLLEPFNAEFGKRLDRTALRLPSSFIDRCVGELERRCPLLCEAREALFEEGRRSRRSL